MVRFCRLAARSMEPAWGRRRNTRPLALALFGANFSSFPRSPVETNRSTCLALVICWNAPLLDKHTKKKKKRKRKKYLQHIFQSIQNHIHNPLISSVKSNIEGFNHSQCNKIFDLIVRASTCSICKSPVKRKEEKKKRRGWELWFFFFYFLPQTSKTLSRLHCQDHLGWICLSFAGELHNQ